MQMSLLDVLARAVLLVVLSTLVGCGGGIFAFDSYAKGWLGHPLQSYLESKQLRLERSSVDIKHPVKLESGNWMYSITDKDDCVINWEVDSDDTIVDYRFEGKGCAAGL